MDNKEISTVTFEEDYTNRADSTARGTDSDPSATNYVIPTLRMTISAIVLAGNLLILCAVKKSEKLHKVTYYLLANLAFADILFGIMFGPFYLWSLIDDLSVYPCYLVRNLNLIS